MSGNKTMTVTAGVSPVEELINLIGAPRQAYQERQRRKREADKQRSAEIQQKIAQITASIGSRVSESKAIEYLQERLDGLCAQLPQVLIQELRSRINHAHAHWEQLADTDLQQIHSKLSDSHAFCLLQFNVF